MSYLFLKFSPWMLKVGNDRASLNLMPVYAPHCINIESMLSIYDVGKKVVNEMWEVGSVPYTSFLISTEVLFTLPVGRIMTTLWNPRVARSVTGE